MLYMAKTACFILYISSIFLNIFGGKLYNAAVAFCSTVHVNNSMENLAKLFMNFKISDVLLFLIFFCSNGGLFQILKNKTIYIFLACPYSIVQVENVDYDHFRSVNFYTQTFIKDKNW
jgi:hypothetical protein